MAFRSRMSGGTSVVFTVDNRALEQFTEIGSKRVINKGLRDTIVEAKTLIEQRRRWPARQRDASEKLANNFVIEEAQRQRTDLYRGYVSNKAVHARFVHEGTEDHDIPGNLVLWSERGGDPPFDYRPNGVSHPGAKANPYLRDASRIVFQRRIQ